MDAGNTAEPAGALNPTTGERRSDRELVVTRMVNGPARLVYKAWTTPDLLMRWWAPTSFGVAFVSCENDVRTGGSYRFVFSHPASPEPMAFFGRYLEVVPNERLVWTNEEAPDGAVTTATFEERDGKTLVVVRELYASKEALDAAIASGSTGGVMFDQLDELMAQLVAEGVRD